MANEEKDKNKTTEAAAPAAPQAEPAAALNPDWLKGLKFRTAETRTIEEEGKPVRKHFPIERALRPSDVMAWKDLGAEVVIVSGDGRKHRVTKGKKD